MENFFSLLELETQNAIKNYVNNEIDEFLELSCENPHLMDFMTGGNDDSLYTVTSDITKKNKTFVKNICILLTYVHYKKK